MSSIPLVAAALFFDVVRGDADPQSVGAHQLNRLASRVFENAQIFLAGFRFHDSRAVTDGDGGRRFENSDDQIPSWELVSDGEQVWTRLAAAAID